MTDTNDPLDQIRQQLGKITPGRWAVAYSRLRVRDNAPVAVERIAMGEIPIASEPATDEWRGHRGHILTFEDRGFVNDIVGEDGAHIVCLGGHEYDDSGAVSVADGEFIAQAPGSSPVGHPRD